MRRRIVWLTVAAAAVAIGLFLIPLALIAEKFYMNEEAFDLERQANSVVSDVSADIQRGRAPNPAWITDKVNAAVYNERGAKIAFAEPNFLDLRSRSRSLE